MTTRSILALLVWAGMCTATVAETVPYPVSPVRILVPAAPGGGTDAAARIFSRYFDRYSSATSANVNQTAGAGIVAAQSTLTGPTDGSTLYFFHASVHVNAESGKSPFSTTDFTALATTSLFNDVLVVRANAPYDTVPEAAAAVAKGSRMTIGAETGGTTELKGQAFADFVGGRARVVDAGAESERLVALLGGQIDATAVGVRNARQYVDDGRIKVLAVLNDDPDAFEPDWPTASSQGHQNSFPLVFTLYGPAGMDPAAVEAMDRIVEAMRADPGLQEDFARLGQAANIRTSAEARDFLTQEAAFVATFFQD